MPLRTDEQSAEVLNAISEGINALIQRHRQDAFLLGVERGKLEERHRQHEMTDAAIRRIEQPREG